MKNNERINRVPSQKFQLRSNVKKDSETGTEIISFQNLSVNFFYDRAVFIECRETKPK